MLLQIDFVWVDRAAREVQQCRLSGSDELVDLLDGARLCDPGASADLGPKHANKDVAIADELLLIASCGLTPACGLACVSHLTGSKTTNSAAACWAFQSLTASVAACRSSAKSDGEAIITRYVGDLNVIGVVLS